MPTETCEVTGRRGRVPGPIDPADGLAIGLRAWHVKATGARVPSRPPARAEISAGPVQRGRAGVPRSGLPATEKRGLGTGVDFAPLLGQPSRSRQAAAPQS